MNIIIRKETLADYHETENLTREAFWNMFAPGCDEHLIVHQLRKSKEFVADLDYVACEGNKILGNIIYTEALVKNNDRTHTVLCMGPLSVLPEYQGQGVGTLLLNTTIEKAKALGYPAVVIFGHPEYYHRFGFKEASEYSIQTSEGKNMDAFMVLDLVGKGLSEISGIFFESPAFQVSKDDLEVFEKRFPLKKKSKNQIV